MHEFPREQRRKAARLVGTGVTADARDARGGPDSLPLRVRAQLVGNFGTSRRGGRRRRALLASLQVQAAAEQPPRAFSHSHWQSEGARGVHGVWLARRGFIADGSRRGWTSCLALPRLRP